MASKKKSKRKKGVVKKQTKPKPVPKQDSGGLMPVIVIGIVALLAGLVIGFSASFVTSPQMNGDGEFIADQTQVEEIRDVMEKLVQVNTGQAFPVTTQTVEKIEVIRMVFEAGGQTNTIFVSEDYSLILGPESPQTVDELKAAVNDAVNSEMEHTGTTNFEEQIEAALNFEEEVVLGDMEAPVTIVEFSDLECPFCQKFHLETWDLLKETYIDTGKVRFVYKHYPLSAIHPNAQKAAEAVECATIQEPAARWDMIDAIFTGGSLTTAQYKTYAEQMGLETEMFNSCLDSGEMAEKITQDMNQGFAIAGQFGTPTFFINGEQISGAQPFSVFSQIIESQLQ